MNTRRYLLRGD